MEELQLFWVFFHMHAMQISTLRTGPGYESNQKRPMGRGLYLFCICNSGQNPGRAEICLLEVDKALLHSEVDRYYFVADNR